LTYWNANKQAAKPFDEHLSEALSVLLRQSIEEVSTKKVKPHAADIIQVSLCVCWTCTVEHMADDDDAMHLPDSCCAQRE